MSVTFSPALRAALADVVPDADVNGAERLGEGWGSTAYLVPSVNGDRVLRIPRPRSYWAAEDLEREVRLLPLLERRPFEIALPREACLLRDGRGSVLAALHRIVPGTPLGEVRHPRGRARARLLADIGRALSVLHGTSAAEAKRHGVREVDLWSEHYVPYLKRTLPVLPAASRAWLAARAEAFERSGGTSSAPRVLIHGDLSGDHFLVDAAGRLSGMIDFADARIADPALDFAGILNELGWRDLERVLEHYAGAVDAGLLDRVRFYIDVSPIYQVTDGAVAIGSSLRRAGIRRLAARAAAARRSTPERGTVAVPASLA